MNTYKFPFGKTSSLLLFVFLNATCFAQVVFIEHTIDNFFNNPREVFAIDLDSDGDMDVLAAGDGNNEICWYENDGQQDFEEHHLAEGYDGASGVFAADIDSDGDIDVLGAIRYTNEVLLWENLGNHNFEEHTIDDNFGSPLRVYAEDIDGDDDIDITAVGYDPGTISWWENEGDLNFTEHLITNNYSGAHDIFAIDLDNDNDMDLISAALHANRVTWWENDGDQEFTPHDIAFNFLGASSIYAVDLDEDEDIDVIGAGYLADQIIWWENNGDENFEQHIVTQNYDWANAIHAGDINLDGSLDIISAAYAENDVTWWENNGHQNFTERAVNPNYSGAISVYVIDLDGDMDLDIVGAAINGNEITWWENTLDVTIDASVDGTVTHATTGNPVENAVVSFGIFDAITDDNGQYSIEEMYSIVYTVYIEADGYDDFIETNIEIEEGENRYDFELFHPASIDIDVDSIQIHCPEEEIDTTHFTIGNSGEVNLNWRIAVNYLDNDNDIEWLTLNMESGSLEPDNVSEIYLIGDADALDTGIYQALLLFATNDPENDNFEIPVNFFVGYEPPDSFNLAIPDSGSIFFDTEINLVWEIATDPNPGDAVVYDVFITGDPENLDDPVAWSLENTFYTFEAPDRIVYFWTVQARDHLNMATMANRIWSFEVRDATQVEITLNDIPMEYSIVSLYPNPFNPSLSLQIALPATSDLNISVFNVIGEEAALLANGYYPPGYHNFFFDGVNKSSGIYFIRVLVPGKMKEIRKVLLIK